MWWHWGRKKKFPYKPSRSGERQSYFFNVIYKELSLKNQDLTLLLKIAGVMGEGLG
jgi:hypothetical protein